MREGGCLVFFENVGVAWEGCWGGFGSVLFVGCDGFGNAAYEATLHRPESLLYC